MVRPAIPTGIVRAVLVEAGHRCAIPTCRSTTTEIAHIAPWAESHDHSFENLIALCPTCHTRYDQKKEIDRKAMQMYKHNLSILNNRYGEFERRVFELLAKSGERQIVLGAGGDILVANAVKDGLLEDMHADCPQFGMTVGSDTALITVPSNFVFRVTDAGLEFLKRFAGGDDIA